MRLSPFARLLAVALLMIPPARADDLSVSAAPPVVVRTVPEAGALGVDPSLKEIKVTFSKEMTDGSWSVANYSPGNAPKVVGKIKYDDDRKTFTVPVKLEPGHCYAIWLNPPRDSRTSRTPTPAPPCRISS